MALLWLDNVGLIITTGLGIEGFECRSQSLYTEVKRMIIEEKNNLVKTNLIHCTILSTFCIFNFFFSKISS